MNAAANSLNTVNRVGEWVADSFYLGYPRLGKSGETRHGAAALCFCCCWEVVQ